MNRPTAPGSPVEEIQEAVAETLSDAAMPASLRHAPWRHGVIVWLATGFWAGFFPYAPGTVGTLWGIPLAWALSHASPAVQAVVLAILALAGIPICSAAARRLGLMDPGCVVYDEFVSLAWAFFLVPLTPGTILTGFVLHRVLDILKPPPIRQLEKLPSGLGIMSDDLAASVVTNLVLQLLVWQGLLGASGG